MKYPLLAALILTVAFSCQKPSTTDLSKTALTAVDYVNPLLGTAPLTDAKLIGYTPPPDWRVWAGLTYPGATLPNAMVQASPITAWGSGAGYEYEDSTLLAFAHTNKGHWNLCHLPVLPLAAHATPPFQSTFYHSQEKASPAYYAVTLADYDIDVRITTTLRTAIHEYSYHQPGPRRILFALGRANHGVDHWEITQPDAHTLQGMQQTGNEHVHFTATLDAPIAAVDLVNEGTREGYAIITLADAPATVTMKMGLSFVSAANAAENLAQEAGNTSFDEIYARGRETWQALLSCIAVEGGTERQRQLFYSSLYRAFLWPALRSDVNGEFMDEQGTVQNKGFRYYTIPSLWDTYRNKLVLLELMQPETTRDIIKSLIDRGEIRGFIPTFFHGDHAASFITGAYLRGLQDFDVQKAYALLLNNAYKEGGTRPHLAEYMAHGYIADADVAHPHTETQSTAGVTKTLEYAYDDYALALLAHALQDDAHAADLQQRAQNYRHVFDTTTAFMRGRLANGSWITPFNPQYPYYEYMYREANAWQVSFFVPHDMPGLVTLYGPARFEQKLDSLFTTPWNPDYIARNVSGMLGQYCQGNQPDHEAPFSYYFIGKPEKSQAVIDQLLEKYYGIGPEGLALAGMDDAGEMSAWYVFNALGLYPLSPTDPQYIVSVPLFETVTWQQPNGQKLVIQHAGTGRNLTSLRVDGQDHAGYFVPHSLLQQGGTLTVQTQP